MLCEGKTTSDVGSEDFWKNRFEFFKTTYKVSKQKFIDYTVKEYRNLCNKKNQKEIVLWFEHDLFACSAIDYTQQLYNTIIGELLHLVYTIIDFVPL